LVDSNGMVRLSDLRKRLIVVAIGSEST